MSRTLKGRVDSIFRYTIVEFAVFGVNQRDFVTIHESPDSRADGGTYEGSRSYNDGESKIKKC